MPRSLIRLETTFKLGIQLKYLKYINLNKYGISKVVKNFKFFQTPSGYCKQLREIPRLPQSVKFVTVENSYSLNPQSSSRLLNQIGEILRILPNNRLLLPEPKDDKFIITLPGTEIPKWREYISFSILGKYLRITSRPTATLMSRDLRKMEEIDPRAFNKQSAAQVVLNMVVQIWIVKRSSGRAFGSSGCLTKLNHGCIPSKFGPRCGAAVGPM
ncbi:hypothetical protein CMV_021704 [Castanea mollissima]|uniref:Uncharacterized protein n=1 Tax=Castanea mollissima TaxID=60419 RepID=A0A8J4QVV1_9ROSI|nr:hypothetical protein CMV_021704 [Castanea mollissima]